MKKIQSNQSLFDSYFILWKKVNSPQHFSASTSFIVIISTCTALLMFTCLFIWIDFCSKVNIILLVFLILLSLALHSTVSFVAAVCQVTVGFARILLVLPSLPHEAAAHAIECIDNELLRWQAKDRYFVFNGFLIAYQRIKQRIIVDKHITCLSIKTYNEEPISRTCCLTITHDREVMHLHSDSWLTSARTPNIVFVISCFAHAFSVLSLIFLFSKNSTLPLIFSTLFIALQMTCIFLLFKHFQNIMYHRYFLDCFIARIKGFESEIRNKEMASLLKYLFYLDRDDILWLFGSRYFNYIIPTSYPEMDELACCNIFDCGKI